MKTRRKKLKIIVKPHKYNDRRIDKIALVITCCFVLLLIFLSSTHYSAEQLQGLQPLQHGILPQDGFHPFLHPILVFVVGNIAGDITLGARLVSNIMAGVFVFAAYWLAAKSVNKKVGLICLGLMVTNLQVITFGVLVSTDMIGAAFAVIVIVCIVQLISHPDSSRVLLLSLAFSLAYCARYQAVLLLPSIFLCLYISFRPSLKRVSLHLLIFGIAICIFLLPHFWLSMHMFGKPVHDENWKNVAAKLYYDKSLPHHETYLEQVPFSGLTDTILHSPKTFIMSGLNEVVLFTRFGASNLLGLPPILAGLFFTGLYFMLFSLSKTRLLLCSCVIVYVVAISFTFFSTYARVTLPILPVCYLIIGDFLVSLDSKITPEHFPVSPVTMFIILLCFAKGISIIPDLNIFLSTLSG